MALTLLRPWKTSPSLANTHGSESIEINGAVIGFVVNHQLGFRFIAANHRVTDMDQSVWPTLKSARQAARQLFGSNCLTNPR
jgi:hypothetical protein